MMTSKKKNIFDVFSVIITLFFSFKNTLVHLQILLSDCLTDSVKQVRCHFFFVIPKKQT